MRLIVTHTARGTGSVHTPLTHIFPSPVHGVPSAISKHAEAMPELAPASGVSGAPGSVGEPQPVAPCIMHAMLSSAPNSANAAPKVSREENLTLVDRSKHQDTAAEPGQKPMLAS
jgi:hypothetical protein